MVTCRNAECGAQLHENAKFCNECGLRVKVAPEPPDKNISVLCPNINDEGNKCLSPIQKGKKFCSSCGWRIDQAIFQPGSEPCTATQNNGGPCPGIIGGESKLCTVCGIKKQAISTVQERSSTAIGVEQSTVTPSAPAHGSSVSPQGKGLEVGGTDSKGSEFKHDQARTDSEGNKQTSTDGKQIGPEIRPHPFIHGHVNAADSSDMLQTQSYSEPLVQDQEMEVQSLDKNTTFSMKGELGPGGDPAPMGSSMLSGLQSAVGSLPDSPGASERETLTQKDSEEEGMETEERDVWRPNYSIKPATSGNDESQKEAKAMNTPTASTERSITESKPMEIQSGDKSIKEQSDKTPMQPQGDTHGQQNPVTVFGYDSTTAEVPPAGECINKPENLKPFSQALTESSLFSLDKQKTETEVASENKGRAQFTHDSSGKSEPVISTETSQVGPAASLDRTNSNKSEEGSETEDSETDSEEDDNNSEKDGTNLAKSEKKKRKLGASKKKREKKRKKKQKRDHTRKEQGNSEVENSGSKNEDEKSVSENDDKSKSSSKEQNAQQSSYSQHSSSSVDPSGSESNRRVTRSQIGAQENSSSHKDKQNEKPDATKQKANGKQQSSSQGTRNDWIEVVLHAILSPALLENKENKVYVYFERDNKSVESKQVRCYQDDYVEYLTTLSIPKHSAHTSLTYYYYVTTKEGNIVEYLYDKHLGSNYVVRRVWIPNQKAKTGIFHHYDGIVDNKPEKWMKWYKKIWSSFVGTHDADKILRSNAEKALILFMNDLLYQLVKGITLEEFLEGIEDIVTGLEHVYFHMAGLWYDYNGFEKFVGIKLKPLLEEMIENTERYNNLPSQALAVAIIYVLGKYHLGYQVNAKHTDILCKQLVLPPADRQTVCQQVENVKKQFPNMYKNVRMSLQNFANHQAGESTNASWLLCVPLLHFLWDKCKPYERPLGNVSHNAKQPEWWGVVEYKQTQDHFRGKTSWNMNIDDIISALSPMFEMDFFLPRTLMTVVRIGDMEKAIASKKFSADICLGKLFNFVATSRYITVAEHEMLYRCLDMVSQLVAIEKSPDSGFKDHLAKIYRTYVIGYDFLLKVTQRSSHQNNYTIVHATAAVIRSFAIFDCVLEDQAQNTPKQQLPVFERNHLTLFDECRQKLIGWLDGITDSFYLEKCSESLKLWDILLQMELPKGTICTGIFASLKERLESIFNRKFSSKLLIGLYCKCLDMYGNHVQGIISKSAMEALNKGEVFQSSYGKDPAENYRYGELLSKVFERHWTTLTVENLFSKALTWLPFQHFLEMFYQEEKSKFLSEDCSMRLTTVASLLHQKMTLLQKGCICIRDLDLISDNSVMFKTITAILLKKDGTPQEEGYLDLLLYVRKMERETFQEVLGHVKGFLELCSFIKVETTAMQAIVDNYSNLDAKPIDSLCKPGILSDMAHPDKYRPRVIAFDLEEDTLELLPKVLQNKESDVFIRKWIELGNHAANQKGENLSILETLNEVWGPLQKWWINICQQMENGNMMFKEFEKIFKKLDEQQLEFEFTLMSQRGNTKWIKQRLKQIHQYRELQGCVAGANAILDVVKCYELKGDFSAIERITDVMEGSDMQMKEMDKSLIETCRLLKGFKAEHTKCLKEFIACKPLVLWLKESMPSGLKELKVFVDLASISAGEGDMELAKVQCLHAATTGYAPLIFNLNDDINYSGFLEKCENVWKELQVDSQLPKKLHDTNRQLAWLKTVKKAHGSVEVTSLTQAEAINSVGIYQIGKLQEIKGNKPALEDVISLHVSEDEQGTRLRKKYRYGQLHDLQSRLMLVAGKAEKGKDDVDRFTMILDSVVRLGNVYTKLLSAGCVLFSDWKAKLLCERARKACCFITFGEGEDAHTLKGRKEKEQDEVSSIVPRIARFMENCLTEWLQYINEKRDRYYHLNFFTIDQMVILQKELVKIGTEKKPSDLIFPLLSAVKKDCSLQDIVEAMKEAQQQVETMDQEYEENMNNSGDEEMKMDETEEINFFINELIQAGYTENLAKKALQHFQPDKVDEAVVWCMDQDDDMEVAADDFEMVTKEEEMDTQAETFQGWTSNQKSISAVTAEILGHLNVVNKEVSVDPLIKGLESLWKTFLNSISSSVSDYLSVEHLGLILKHLAEKELFAVNRDFLQCFKSGMPNLIICPQVDLLNTMLTIYMHSPKQALPQPDEVLICSSHTTLDQLDTFWRRAVFATSGRIHCLVNGDLLDYDVSDKGDQCLEQHMEKAKDKGINYRLVVLCSTENEYKSRIVAALDRFRRPHLPVANRQAIRQYLQHQFRVDSIPGKVVPAARVDFDQSTVRVVKSWRAGVGKSLYKKRLEAELNRLYSTVGRKSEAVVTIPLHEREIDVDAIMSRLLECTLQPGHVEPRIFHIDVSHEVYVGVDAFLFHLLILGCLSNSAGYVWRKSPHDHYLVETMPQLSMENSVNKKGEVLYLHKSLDVLPDMICRSPEESLDIMRGVKKPPDYSENDRLFDHQEFVGTVFQRPYQYLKHLDENKKLTDVDPYRPQGDEINCLQILLRHCGMRDPSWAELKHFVWFLNTQLQDFEVSAFCSLAAMEDLPGFAKFVLKFLIQMSRDFATRSLNISEESPVQKLQYLALQDEEDMDTGNEEQFIQQFQMRRTWESSPHPYIFFNPDHNSMTFLGFNIDRGTGNLVDLQTGTVLEQSIMDRNLQDSLIRNRVNINENFDALPRGDKIQKLCSVMGMEMPYDPDETYELTTDNVKKILAIYMRFKCDIPVIIMGETGCGKTRLVKFMCSLQCPPGVEIQNMILMKVHGGTKSRDIMKKVQDAEEIAKKNIEEYGEHLQTVLFFDEANTTEAIGLIKEIMCDKTLGGKPLKLCQSLKIIAACNPYRKHSDELIKRLEQAGLGYHVDADSTVDRLGRIPMRRLVYRVQPLPQSLLPLVWDFGQLDTRVEELYIRQMVLRYINNGKLPQIGNLENVVSRILTVSQDFMRDQKDECSFVSLRDVERVLEVMSWFYAQAMDYSSLFKMMDGEEEEDSSEDEEDYVSEDEESVDDRNQNLPYVTRSLVLALGVCYHACLKKREDYREAVAQHFADPCPLPGGADRMLQEIESCQDVFLNNVQLGKNIAQNQALKENVFMMVTCIELRIPLFLVGKPGSSKSLAKTIVADAMQGHAAHKQLFREYKTAQMVSFQCSPLSVPEGIVGTFRQCATFQKDRDLDTFVSVVVLDEVGLAEDSPRMPLKTLHPLLEDGCEGDEAPEPHKKVAFIGISNWALDPAKMNRGILVQREVPELKELTQSAEGICSSDKKVLRYIKPVIENMAESYLELFQEASKQLREFFGLRDFYSLLKMVYAFADKNRKRPSWKQLEHAILRNFGGMEGIDPVKVFTKKLTTVNICEKPSKRDPDCTPAGLIQACLEGDGNESESRYLLLLTENYGALNILQQKILTMHNAITIFGSSFPSDQEYTQVCRNINRIKVCMETGSTVVLLNLENLYESLYDALNQYYVEFGGERYVDLGLGSHRVKCRVHKQFRLIVVAEKQTVYEKFPIPLINRLEKHFLNISTMLTPLQLKLAEILESWTKDFAKIQAHFIQWGNRKSEFNVSDVFMGYHADMCAAVILHVIQEQDLDAEKDDEKILKEAKKLLIWCATPDAVMRLSSTPLKSEEDFITNIYFVEQQHECLSDYLYQRLQQAETAIFAQITTHSKLITTVDLGELSKVLKIPPENMVLLTLQSFDTEQQFCRQIRGCLDNKEEGKESLLVVQSDCGDQNSSLVACARYCIQDELQEIGNNSVHVVFIIQLPRIAGGCFSGFQCGRWHSLHIDDLRPAEQDTLTIPDMRGQSVGMLIHKAVDNGPTYQALETMDTSDIEEGRSSQEIDIMNEPRQESEYAQMDVDQNDIHVNIVSNEIRSHHRLPINKLIFGCIQSALAMVKDSKAQKSRETERVTIMLQLLHQTNQMNATELILGLGKHLDLLLQEKEKSSTNAQNWLAAEAARAENINTAGTFRRAWMQCMETKVIPVLAGIIAFIDTNNNLDCLSRSEPGNWRQQLWMEVINCPQATGMQYNKQLVSPGRNAEVTEVMVGHTGAEGHLLTGDMPFSWLIFRLIEDAVKTTYATSEDSSLEDTEIIMKTRNVVMNTPFGRILQPVVEQNVQEATQAYLRDFVHLIYPVKTEPEHQLVCESMYIGTRAILEGQFGDGLAVIVGFHVSYRRYASRLKNFSNLNRVWTECSSSVIEFQSKTPTFYLITDEEMTLDVLGLYLLLEKLEPEPGILNKYQGRNDWLKRVHQYRPAVERIMDMFLPGSSPENAKCGKRCCRGINQARLIWTSVVVVKLFLEHVCSMTASREKDQLSVKRVMPLWTMIKTGVDMKKKECIEKVEKFLKMCNKTATSQIFDISKEKNACKVCESPFEGPPVTLPCKDIICTKCWNEMKVIKDLQCPICRKEIKENFDPSTDRTKNQLYTKYFDYKKRCNSFFIEVVSQLCFADGTAPDSDVVDKLMKYITRETKSQKVVTKEMSIFDDDIDPTPVLRSFLLQLVLRTNSDQVYQYLEDYMKQADSFVDMTNKQDPQLIELCLLIVQCIEDSYHHEISKSEDPEAEEVSMAMNMLKNARDVILGNQETLNVQTLLALAQTRFGLMVAAKYVQEIYVAKSRKTDKSLRRLLEAASQLCQDCGTRWPCIFFIKYLCRCYGLESYEVVSNSNDPNMCRWIRMLNLQRDEKLECTDNYIVCGQQYAELRELVTKCLLGEKTESLEEKLQELQGPDWKTRTWLLLAVHREITMSNVYPEDKRQAMPKTVEPLMEFLIEHTIFQGQESLIRALMQNLIWRRHDRLNIREGLGLQDQSIACLLVHALITILQLPGDRTLLQPLLSLASQPQTMVNAFLPTMPQDDLAEIKEALLQGRRQFDFDENPVLYRCPNGHPYIIGNCGNPAYVGKCKECGADIGGQGYILQAGNVKDTGEDKTQPGHILGRAQKRVVAVQTERKMTPVGCATLRLLTHIVMMLGANENPQAIYNMIRPNIEENEVHDFLLSHIKLDITILQKTTGYSSDDVVLLMHNLLSTMLNTHNQGENQTADFASKESRNRWEEMFTARYITPLLQTMDDDLKRNNNLVASDKRLGSDPLLCLLYETDSPQEATVHLYDVPAVWRYRKRISMDHMATEFHNQMKNNYKVLQLFLKEEQQLRALRLVPSIMRLQKMLIQKYQRKLDRAEANTSLSLAEVESDFERDGKEEEVHQLILDFAEAWDCVRESLSNFPCPTVDGYATLSREYCCRQVTMDTNVSMLLPSQRDVGLCSYILLYYLLKKQNSFLDKYYAAKKQRTKDLPKVKVADITPAHLISYHPDRDILSIVLANCNYSFEVGQGTTITYDFQNIERQLMDRFLFSKSYIEIDEIEVMTFRSDATNSAVFAGLRDKISQVPLGAAVRRQICEEFRSSLPEICDCLDNLDITISFLKSVGEDPDSSLDRFMTNTLKMRNSLFNQKARQVCQCKHAQSLWITLSLEKTKCLAMHNRNACEGIRPDFRKEMTEEQTKALEYFCDGLQIDKLDMLIECLFECLMLRLTIAQNPEDEDYVDVQRMSLRDFLMAHMESPLYDEEITYPNWMMEALGRLPADSEDPKYLQVSHAVEVWLCMYQCYRRKGNERRR